MDHLSKNKLLLLDLFPEVVVHLADIHTLGDWKTFDQNDQDDQEALYNLRSRLPDKTRDKTPKKVTTVSKPKRYLKFKSSRYFSTDQRATLTHWYYVHTKHPFPSKDEMIQLIAQTNLTRKQIQDWMCNARRRFGYVKIRQYNKNKKRNLDKVSRVPWLPSAKRHKLLVL